MFTTKDLARRSRSQMGKALFHHEDPSAAEPQPKLGVSPAKTQRAQSSEIESENHL